jgi:MFS family permease
MTMKHNTGPKTPQELRKFGFIMAVAFLLITAFLMWRGRHFGWYTLGASLFFTLTALIVPWALEPIEKGWMWFGEKMSVVMTFVLLSLLYFLVITPIGLALRLFGKDLLALKRRGDETTYWVPVEPDGPGSRFFLPY